MVSSFIVKRAYIANVTRLSVLNILFRERCRSNRRCTRASELGFGLEVYQFSVDLPEFIL